MFLTIKQFADAWKQESDGTRKILAALTDESLSKQIAQDHRTIGRLAWHIVQTLPEMAGGTGLQIEGPVMNQPVPTSVKDIQEAYDKAAQSLYTQVVSNWTDDTLQVEDEMYGQKWKRGLSLWGVMIHEIHHRAQMTVLMRQAGLKVPGLYGPSYEEWAAYGGKPPEI